MCLTAWCTFFNVSEASDCPKHVEVESDGIYSSDDGKEAKGTDFMELTQLSLTPSVKMSPGFAVREFGIQDFLRSMEGNFFY